MELTTQQEKDDMRFALVLAMKQLDLNTNNSADKMLSDRLEVMTNRIDGIIPAIQLVSIDHKDYEMLKAKAEKWDKLENKIAIFYSSDSEEEGDLGDIGEAAATAFGFL